MTVLTLAMLGAVALWQVRASGDETAATTPVHSTSTMINEGTPAVGGMAERYAELETRVTTRGGLGELWAEQARSARLTAAVDSSDQEMYQRWLQGTATVVYLVDSAEERTFILAFTQPLEEPQLLAGRQPIPMVVRVASALDQPADRLGERIVDLRAHPVAGVGAVPLLLAPVTVATSVSDTLARQLEALTAEGAGLPFVP